MSDRSAPTTRPCDAADGQVPWVSDRCGRCGDGMAVIDFVVDGHAFSMRSCTRCDHRSWCRAGVTVDLDGVLADLTSSLTRYRRDLAVP